MNTLLSFKENKNSRIIEININNLISKPYYSAKLIFSFLSGDKDPISEYKKVFSFTSLSASVKIVMSVWHQFYLNTFQKVLMNFLNEIQKIILKE